MNVIRFSCSFDNNENPPSGGFFIAVHGEIVLRNKEVIFSWKSNPSRKTRGDNESVYPWLNVFCFGAAVFPVTSRNVLQRENLSLPRS
jgi:hypothetical protein